MQMLDNLFGPQVNSYQRALGRATQRHSLLTENLANVNTPGYKRKDIDFNIQLDEATTRLGSEAEIEDPSSVRIDGNGVDMEQEVMSLAETELRYQALTDITANYFTNLKSVIREGK